MTNFKPGDRVPVPLKNTTANVIKVVEHNSLCPGRDKCSRPDVPMVQLESDDGFQWGWFHANTLESP